MKKLSYIFSVMSNIFMLSLLIVYLLPLLQIIFFNLFFVSSGRVYEKVFQRNRRKNLPKTYQEQYQNKYLCTLYCTWYITSDLLCYPYSNSIYVHLLCTCIMYIYLHIFASQCGVGEMRPLIIELVYTCSPVQCNQRIVFSSAVNFKLQRKEFELNPVKIYVEVRRNEYAYSWLIQSRV